MARRASDATTVSVALAVGTVAVVHGKEGVTSCRLKNWGKLGIMIVIMIVILLNVS